MGKIPMRLLLVVATLCLTAGVSSAQQLPPGTPTPEQAEILIRTRPDLVARARQELARSGLTPDQIRARLRAEGYSETVLSALLPGGGAIPDSLTAREVFSAVLALGISDTTEIMMLGVPGLIDPVDTMSFLPVRDRARAGAVRNGRLVADLPGVPVVDSGYDIYGLDIFQGATSQFQPNIAGPVDPGYRLGPGDQLVLILTGDVEAAHSLEVTRQGFIVVPNVGQLNVANLTLGQLEDLLYARLGRVYSGVRRGAGATTHFSITPARLRTNQVYVIGDVVQPGSKLVSAAGTALTALYAAGGPSNVGSMRRIEIRRAGRTVDTLDLYDYLTRGDATGDARLEHGDFVFVPVFGARVRVVGEVLRPATYEVRDGETLADVIRFAGGFTAEAAQRRVQIERILPSSARPEPGRERVVIDLGPDQFTSSQPPSFPLENGDVVRVFPVANRVRNRVTVAGNVWSPGAIGFTPGMRLSDAVQLAGGVKPDVYLGQILVSRLLPDSTRIQLRSAFRDTTGAVVDDLALAEDDVVEIFSVSEFRPERYVAVLGAVKRAGRYPYRDGMTMRDLVLMAGGLEEGASLQRADVARLPEDRDGGRTAVTFSAPLDSSYLFERGPDGRYFGPPGLPAPSGPAPEVELEPYDNVLILRQPDFELHRTVTLLGEVRFPGTYTLVSKGERLRDLLQRAGGLTPEGYADGVYFYRKQNNLGRIGIDLPRVMRDERHNDNLILQDGDSIAVPAFSAVVNVTGAVNSPVAVSYVQGRDIDFYIRAAGGPSRNAEEERAYVTQPNGKVESRSRRLFFASTPTPRPGSTVFVPTEDPNAKRDMVAAIGSIAQILASLVAIVAVASR